MNPFSSRCSKNFALLRYFGIGYNGNMINPVPRVAAIHDLSGFGRASLTVVIPILSTMGTQVCPLPTALLSTHTSDFTDYHITDLTRDMKGIIRHWKELNLRFDAVYSGFLGSPEQIRIVSDFITHFGKPEGNEKPLIVVDPVMGDDGVTYGPIGPEMIQGMKELIKRADIITPNLTEAAFLLDRKLPSEISLEEAKAWARELSDRGPRVVIITSVPLKEHPNTTGTLALDREDGRYWMVRCSYVPAFFPGTGDIFTSVITGSLLQGDSLPIAMDRAVQYVSITIRASFGHRFPLREGVLLERTLDTLRAPVTAATYELL